MSGVPGGTAARKVSGGDSAVAATREATLGSSDDVGTSFAPSRSTAPAKTTPRQNTRSGIEQKRHAMNSGCTVLYLVSRAVLLTLFGIVGAAAGVHAQTEVPTESQASEPRWTLILDGETASWPEDVPSSLDSIRGVSRQLLERYRRDGYYYARVDSATIDTAAVRTTVRLHVHRGPRVVVGGVRFTGETTVPLSTLRSLLETEEGSPLDPRQLEADIQALLAHYEEIGRPLAQIRVEETVLKTTPTPRLRLTLSIDEGPELWLKRIEVPADARTSPGLVARLSGLNMGEPLIDYDPEAIQSTLQESPFFRSVDPPALRVTSDGGAILRVPVEESAPGAFDLVLGYLPPSGTGGGGQLVGSGHLLLEHLFGGGRRVDLTLDRRPGQTSIFDLSVSDPYIFGLPFRMTSGFRGEQRDSTYGERTYTLNAGYHFNRSFEVSGRLSREVVKPGQSGTQIRGGRQRIPRSQTLFYGVGGRYESVDRRTNPRRGFWVDVHVDQGQKERSLQRVTAEGDTIRDEASLRQERFRGTVRAFVPLFDRHVVVMGGDGAVIRSRSYDRSDLFRFGGAESLRGYDEDRFLGNVTLRGLVEYRVQLDRRSYLYAFGDLGYVERPPLGRTSATQEWHPGYGVGIQVQTAIGLIRTTYALNPEVSTPADGRLHFGLSVGL